MIITFEKTCSHAQCPAKATPGSAGFDVYAAESHFINPGETVLVPLGFKVRVPEGYEIQVRSRSSLALMGIIIPNAPGTIDSDYRGEVKVILHNIGVETFSLPRGYKVAQLVVAEVPRCAFVEGTVTDNTSRGEGGFGSTGRF